MALLQIKTFLTNKIISLVGGQKVMTLQIDITNACNLSCAHCYHSHHNNKGAIGLEDWFGIIEQYKGLIEYLRLRPRIVICGGEPTISPMLLPILEKLNLIWPNLRISILTNGTRLTDDLLDKLNTFNIELQVSLDGPDSQRHDEIRGKGTFDKAVEGVKRARAQGIDVFILAILSKKTALWIEDFFEMAKSLNINHMNFTRFISQGSGMELEASGKDRALYPMELKRAMELVVEQSRKHQMRTSTDQALYNLIDSDLGANEKFGFQGIIIDYKGNLKVSSRADFVIGNVLSEGLENLFLNNSILKNLRQANIENCGGCKHYGRCGGNRNASYAATGSFLKADPGCWL